MTEGGGVSREKKCSGKEARFNFKGVRSGCDERILQALNIKRLTRHTSTLILVESPIQLLNATRLAEEQSLDCYLVLRTESGGHNYNQVKNAVEKYPWKSTKHFTFNKNCICSRIINLFFLCWYVIKIRATKVNQIVFGDARSIAYKLIKPTLRWRCVALVDDGLYLYPFHLEKSRKLKGVNIYTNLPLLITDYYRLIPVRYDSPVMRPKESTREVSQIFIGSKLVEADILNLDDLILLLTRVYGSIKSYTEGPIFYFAHREEQYVSLTQIQKIGFRVVHSTQPLESYVAEFNLWPSNFYSFYSSALYNIAITYGIPVTAFKLPHDRIKWNCEAIDQVYSLFECTDLINVEVIQ